MLKIVGKNIDFQPLWLMSKTFSIGSADNSHLVLRDPSVSLQHARILLQNDAYVVRDLSSQSGTYVNGRQVNQRQLKNRDLLRLGEVELEVIDPFTDSVLGANTPWSLIACSNWLSGQEFPLVKKKGSGPIKVGRGSHCDVTFPGTHLSREHVELEIDGDVIRMKDLNSTNGTFINDKQVNEGVLRSGDKLRLDVYSFQVLGPRQPVLEDERYGPRERQDSSRPTAITNQLNQASQADQHPTQKRTSRGGESDTPTSASNRLLAVAAGAMLLSMIGVAWYFLATQ